MLWSIDSCQNRVSADQYHLTVSRAQVSTHRGRVFFEVIRWQVTSFQMIAGSSSIFYGVAGKEGSYFWFTITRWSSCASNFYALIGQNLTGEFMRKIYAASRNLLTDSWSWQSFASSCDFLIVFFHWMSSVQNEIQLQDSSVIHIWLVYWVFGPTMRRLLKSLETRLFRMASCSPRLMLKSLKRFWPYLMAFRSCISTGKPE